MRTTISIKSLGDSDYSSIKKDLINIEEDTKEVYIRKGEGSTILFLPYFVGQSKDTGQYFIYIPTTDSSAYGETRKKAEEIINKLVADFFKDLMKM